MRFKQTKNYPIIFISLAALCLSLPYWILTATTSKSSAAPRGIEFARLSEQVSIRAEGVGSPCISLSDGHTLLTAYEGEPSLAESLARNQARPLALASADFDEDGVPDLIAGYEATYGEGIIVLHRGNIDAIYPNAPEAQARRANGIITDAPFLSPALVYSVPVGVDFVGAGDFDGDSHWDVVAARRSGTRLYLLSGDGRGGLKQTRQIELPGRVTALVVGEINRRDGLDDVMVAVNGKSGAQVLVYEGPQGALRTKPEVFAAPEEVTGLAVGQLDHSYEMDLAIAAGHKLLLVHGRDRLRSLNEEQQRKVKAARVGQRAFNNRINSIAVGDFTGHHATDLAVLSEDGAVQLLSRNGAANKKQKLSRDIKQWDSELLTRGSASDRSRLVGAQISSHPVANLVVVDSNSSSLKILSSNAGANRQAKSEASALVSTRGISARLDLTGEATAVLPMRLNGDALSDLIILTPNHSAPAIITTVAQTIFTVTNLNDSGPGSFRNAIEQANANPGADVISFNFAGTPPFIIAPQSLLPEISDAVTIDGTTQPGFAGTPVVELDGAAIVPDDGLLVITSGNSVVKGLIINRAPFDIALVAGGGNVVEGNFIGAGPTGAGGSGRGRGVLALNSDNNTIGGTVPQARNIISGIVDGIQLNDSTGCLIIGNMIGLNRDGSAVIGISDMGIIMNSAHNSTIGGTVAGARNVFAGIENASVDSFEGRGNLIQGNFIGTDATGTINLGNKGSGVVLAESVDQLGGTTVSARNIISGNGSPSIGSVGVGIIGGDLSRSTGCIVQGNFIGTDVTGTLPMGNREDGITIRDFINQTLIGGVTEGARNVIAANIGHGIGIGILAEGRTGGTQIIVEGNFIGTDVSGTLPMGNGESGVFVDADSVLNSIENNLIAFNGSAGVFIPDNRNPGVRIAILSNAIFSNGGLGIDLGDSGVTNNDEKDLDGGANLQQNFPVLTSVTPSRVNRLTKGVIGLATNITITGTFNSTPNQTFTLQFFFGTQVDASGRQFKDIIPSKLEPTMQVMTDNNGNAPFTYMFEFPSGYRSGWVNATATSATGNTSEQTECIPVTNPNPLIIENARKEGKHFYVTGVGFAAGAKLFVNNVEKKTRVDSATSIFGKKAAKGITYPAHIRVRNPDGSESNEYTFTLP